jgi:hypothetical protein
MALVTLDTIVFKRILRNMYSYGYVENTVIDLVEVLNTEQYKQLHTTLSVKADIHIKEIIKTLQENT